MGVGFKKSFLGFNCDDVLSYIENTHKAHSEKEQLLDETIADQNQQIADLSAKLDSFREQNSQLSAQLNEYIKKSDEINRLSEEIGRLYLVSKASAKSIISNAQQSSKLAYEQVNKHIDAVESVNSVINDVKETVISSSDSIVQTVDKLSASLDRAKTEIKSNVVIAETEQIKSDSISNELLK